MVNKVTMKNESMATEALGILSVLNAVCNKVFDGNEGNDELKVKFGLDFLHLISETFTWEGQPVYRDWHNSFRGRPLDNRETFIDFLNIIDSVYGMGPEDLAKAEGGLTQDDIKDYYKKFHDMWQLTAADVLPFVRKKKS